MSDLQKTPIVDKNGKHTTVNKRIDKPAAPFRVPQSTPKPAVNEDDADSNSEIADELMNKYGTTKFRRISDGEIVSLVDVQETRHLNLSSNPLLDVTFKDSSGEEAVYLAPYNNNHFAAPFEGYKVLESEPHAELRDSFSADNADSIDGNTGSPFKSFGVFELSKLSVEGEYYPETNYPILISYGLKPDLALGTNARTFTFTGIDGNEFTFTIPQENYSKLESVQLEPLRHPWDYYEPEALR